jgi:hypothetical protein
MFTHPARSPLRIDQAQALHRHPKICPEASEDKGSDGRIGHEEVQVFLPLTTESGHPATALTLRKWLEEEHLVNFLLDLVDELDASEILISAEAKDPHLSGVKDFDPQM